MASTDGALGLRPVHRPGLVPDRRSPPALVLASPASIIVIAAVLLLTRGLTPSIDFRGGSEFIVSGVSDTAQQPAIDAIQAIAPDDQARVSVVGTATSAPCGCRPRS